jgi:hypothetical protein
VREVLRKTDEVLKLAAYFAQAEPTARTRSERLHRVLIAHAGTS